LPAIDYQAWEELLWVSELVCQLPEVIETGMLNLMQRLGFERHVSPEESGVVIVTKRLCNGN